MFQHQPKATPRRSISNNPIRPSTLYKHLSSIYSSHTTTHWLMKPYLPSLHLSSWPIPISPCCIGVHKSRCSPCFTVYTKVLCALATFSCKHNLCDSCSLEIHFNFQINISKEGIWNEIIDKDAQRYYQSWSYFIKHQNYNVTTRDSWR